MKKKIWLVDQGIWDLGNDLHSIPLALGYLKAMVEADEDLASELDVRIIKLKPADTPADMARRLLFDEVPDLMAFSVLGWNYYAFGAVAKTFRQRNPNGWVVFGGTHVVNQGRRVFGMFPEVDVVCNGEGEFIFRDIVRHYLAGGSRHDLASIDGVSYQDDAGVVHTTPSRPRIADLDEVPSPFLTGALPLVNPDGTHAFDMIQMETNRGCPYKCSFCFWGGAIGQKVRLFSRERLRSELDLIGFHKYTHLGLCDANVGMFPEDLVFMEDVIKVREKYGYPQEVACSWAKNKSKIFHQLVREMKKANLTTNFVISLQTLNDQALDWMQRKNMKINAWENLAEWLTSEGLVCQAELIWGAPGETPESFMEGYDRVARSVSRISVFPLLILPNTEYASNGDAYGLVTIRNEKYDFENVLCHNTMSLEENAKMMQFIYFAKVFSEFSILRHVWAPLRELVGMTQSQVVQSLERWFAAQDHPLAAEVNSFRPQGLDILPTITNCGGNAMFWSEETTPLLHRWWSEEVMPRVPAELAGFFEELFRFERLTAPIHADWPIARELPTVSLGLEQFLVREEVPFEYDVEADLLRLKRHEKYAIEPKPTRVSFYYRTGYGQTIESREFMLLYVGKTAREMFPDPEREAPRDNDVSESIVIPGQMAAPKALPILK